MKYEMIDLNEQQVEYIENCLEEYGQPLKYCMCLPFSYQRNTVEKG